MQKSSDIPKNDYKSAKILVVDDTKLGLNMLIHILKNNGMNNIISATNGKEAYDLAIIENPDVIITDLIMPVMDGYELCKKIREYPKFQDIAIIVQTAMSSSSERSKVFSFGANDILLRPISADELIARVKMHIEKQEMFRILKGYNKRVGNELNAAKIMQEGILPSSNYIKETNKIFPIECVFYFEASSELSGDFWGIKHISDKKFAIYLVDFTGHGVIAAMNTFRLHTLMHLDISPSDDAGAYLAKLNARLKDLLPIGQFATMFYGVIDTDKNTLSYATAATPSPILFSAQDKKFTIIDGSGFPLGVVENAKYQTNIIDFNKDDMLICYSDALIEKECNDGRLYNKRSLVNFCSKYHKSSNNDINMQDFCTATLQDFYNKTGSKEIDDDLTIVMLKHT